MTAQPSSSRRRWPVYAAIVALAAAGAWYFSKPGKQPNRRPPNPAWAGQGEPKAPVKVVLAEKRQLPVHLKAIGTVTPADRPRSASRIARCQTSVVMS